MQGFFFPFALLESEHIRFFSALIIKECQSHFHLLQIEEQEEQEAEERQWMMREEQLKTEPRPPSVSSDSDSESEEWGDNSHQLSFISSSRVSVA